MTNKHSRGPWSFFLMNGEAQLQDADHTPIIHPQFCPDENRAAADFRLMAAAPDLLQLVEMAWSMSTIVAWTDSQEQRLRYAKYFEATAKGYLINAGAGDFLENFDSIEDEVAHAAVIKEEEAAYKNLLPQLEWMLDAFENATRTSGAEMAGDREKIKEARAAIAKAKGVADAGI